MWVSFLFVLLVWGGLGYIEQLKKGLAVTNMQDSISWGFYIGNFAFFVGVAAAAILLVIPAYIYHWKPIREITIFGELLAISAVIMALGFVIVDLGGPFRLWHMIPVIGLMNFPDSLLAWDSIVLSVYFLLNLIIVTHLLYRNFIKKEYNKKIFNKLILLSIPMAISIHTVTAFLFNGLSARPYWNSALLAPKFIASAFCSGPAVLLILFQILKKTTKFEIKQEAIWKIAELMAYSMFVYLFLFFSEIFKEVYSDTHHLVHLKYLFFGVKGHTDLVIYAWASIIFSITAFLLFLIPKTRKNVVTLNIGAVLIFAGVYIEKGIALIIPGFSPDSLGQLHIYSPSWTEIRTSAMIFALGFLLFTFMSKIAVEIMFKDLTAGQVRKQTGASV